MHPAVSVLLPVRDGGEHLERAVASALAQTLVDVEVVLVDDGSTDGAVDRVAARFGSDPRLRSERGPPRGIVASLNLGLRLARADLVARLDADDVSHPERLALQAALLHARPEVGLVGCRVRAFPARELGRGMRAYLRWQDSVAGCPDIHDALYVESPFVHSTVMFRRSLVLEAGGYAEGPFPEDYELWLRLARAGVRMHKLDRCLVDWRQHAGSLSRNDPRYARDAFDRLRAEYLASDRRLLEGRRRGRPLAVWGAGRRTRGRCRHLIDRGFGPLAWIDIDPRKIGNEVWGAPVVAPSWLDGRAGAKKPFVLVYVASHGARELIAPDLQRRGYARGTDYLLVG